MSTAIQQSTMKFKYRVRWFSSKGAFLVLLWTSLVFCTVSLLLDAVQDLVDISNEYSSPLMWLYLFPLLVAVVSVPLSGWLADAKFGNYKVFRVGAILLFISTVMNCLFLIIEEMIFRDNYVLKLIHLCLVLCLLAVSGCACFVTALPLGLDQMPDASASSITSYVAWVVCIFLFGDFLKNFLSLVKKKCMEEHIQSSFSLILALLLAFCATVVLISIFLLSPKWLIIEPKSPQSLKNIYRVLKFAAKHKAPLSRSALTYWEENVPSRIDLAKSKYGGPFTTEQVEDVKTMLHLLVISLPFCFCVFSLCFRVDTTMELDELFSNLTDCNAGIKNFFVSSFSFYGILGGIAYEFLVYPIVVNRLPSILKRIGTVILIMMLVNFLCFVLILTWFLSHPSETIMLFIARTLHQSIGGITLQVLMCSALEFMCAQSPYNMRGLLLSFLLLLASLIYVIGLEAGFFLVFRMCTQSWCFQLIPSSLKTVLCLIIFLLFCVAARWYKMRVRDEDYSPQRVVEEVYDRYLTAAASQSRSYGTS